MILWPVC